MSSPCVLALETSGAVGTVALEIGGRIEERTIATPREQTERVLGLIDDLLAEAGIGPARLEAIVFGRGPGSFTGLRVAAAVTQGLSFATGCPIVPVSSLAALALGGFAEFGARSAAGRDVQALCLVDARMGEVYSARFSLADGLPVAAGDEQLGPPAGIDVPAGDYFVVGDAAAAYAEPLAAVLAAAGANLTGCAARATDLLALARPAIAAGQFVERGAALPVYLRESGAWHKT